MDPSSGLGYAILHVVLLAFAFRHSHRVLASDQLRAPVAVLRIMRGLLASMRQKQPRQKARQPQECWHRGPARGSSFSHRLWPDDLTRRQLSAPTGGVLRPQSQQFLSH